MLFTNVLMSGCGQSPGKPIGVTPIPRTRYDFVPPPRQTAAANPAAVADEQARQADRLLASFDMNSEFAYLSTLASGTFQGRKTGSAGARAAAAYIKSEFSSLGLQPWTAAGLTSFSHDFTAAGLESENVVGVLPGSRPDGAYVILAAHYDHLGLDGNGQPYNGADDDAAGVAAVLESARIFQQTGIKPEKTIIFCAFAGEEEHDLGSSALGKQIINAGLGDSVEMINIDGIGATGGDYFGVWDEGFAGAAPLVRALEQAGQSLGIRVKEEGTDIGSDAQSFDWQYGIPAVTVDWSWGSDPSVWHPNYHTIYDNPDQINQSVLAQATKVALLGLWFTSIQP
jgi:hypothetical protein